MSAQKSHDVLEQNVGSLLGSSYDPPKLDPAARSRIRSRLVAKHARARPATSPLVAVGFGLAAAAAIAVVAGALLGRDHRAGTGVKRDGQEVALADGSTAVLDQGAALDVLAREELGIDPAELGGSARVAAITSFLLFAFGAAFPVLPYLFASGTTALVASIAISGIVLFGVGAAITIFTGRSVWVSGGRQTGLGLAAAGLTFGVGSLLGAAVG